MKCFKFCYKSKVKQETKYFPISDFKSIKYDHKTKYLEVRIQEEIEAGFIKLLNLLEFDLFLDKSPSTVFPFELFETEEEVC
jgi:hypothetical protein